MKHFLTILINGVKQNTIQLNSIPAFETGRVTLGRSEDNDIVVPYAAVSRHHAAIEIRPGAVDIVDVGSLNKLRVNGVAYERIRMTNGTQVLIGTSADNVMLCYNTIDDVVQETQRQPVYHEVPMPEQEDQPGLKRIPRRKPAKFNFAPRLFAFLADFTICAFMGIGSAVIMLFLLGGVLKSMKLMILCTGIMFILVTWLYYALSDSGESMGTLGKTILGIRVADAKTGERVTFKKASIRYFAKIVSTIILFLGYLPIYGRKQTLHDSMAGTVVIKNKKG